MTSYELCLDEGVQDYYLFQQHSEDRVNLGKGPVHIDTANGSTYVSTSEWTQWAEELFPQQVVEKPDGSLWVVWPETKQTLSLPSYQQSHKPIQLGVQVFGSSSIVQYSGFLLDHFVDGARLFLGLKTLYECVIGNSGNMTASRWYQS
eukprot:2593640-Amphidinium_carterae.1